MSKNFSRRSAAAREGSPAVQITSTSLQIAGDQAGDQRSHPTSVVHSNIINTGEGSTLSTLSNALDKLSIPPPKKPVKPTGAEGRVASRPFKLIPRSTIALSSDSDSDSGPELTPGCKPTRAKGRHTEGPAPVSNIASQPFMLIPRSEIISSGSEAESGPEGILCSQPFALIPRGGHAIDISDSESHLQPAVSQPFALVDRVGISSDESSHEALPVIEVHKSVDALLGDNFSDADSWSPSGSTPQPHLLLHSIKAEQLEAILGSDSDSEVGSKGKNPAINKGFQDLENMSGNTAMFGVGNIQQPFDSEAGPAGPSGPPESVARAPKPSWVEVVDAAIDDAHGPNTCFRPPAEARFVSNRNVHSRGEGPMTAVATYERPLKPSDIELDSTRCISNFDPPIKFSYTEQQLYNVHMGVLDSDFDDNTYENKLHVFNSARRNQMQAEILSVNILSEVAEELETIQDLLRPWI
ncbi:hypothetical protein BDZ97DRAFT_1926125 [Flammula alnicola]|nr:hypothetical protein BDZ97DRAFT_1926125 [Flammula alnicola]